MSLSRTTLVRSLVALLAALLLGAFASAYGAELYNPSTGTWARTGSMNAARNDFTATLLTNGQVLAVGRYRNDPLKGAVAPLSLTHFS
jgi:hypothetical protein